MFWFESKVVLCAADIGLAVLVMFAVNNEAYLEKSTGILLLAL